MLARKLRCPPTTSLGRWFDAAAGLLGVRDLMHYEGQAAMELEGLAVRHGPVDPLPGGYILQEHDAVLDFSPILPALMGCQDAAYGAAFFHATVAAGLSEWAIAAARREKVATIAVGGGCAMNAVLITALRCHLDAAGVDLLEARQAPPNDGGLALGQAWVARRMLLAGLPPNGENQGELVLSKEMS
jgi:hydrogenase maturation protein HypF